MENTQTLDYVYYCVSFEFLTVNELSTRRYLIVRDANINQCKGILTSEFGSKDILLWKRGSIFVSTEDENLWINSRLM